jgi:hypothetical protein
MQIGKKKGKKATRGVEKQLDMRGEKIIFGRGGG